MVRLVLGNSIPSFSGTFAIRTSERLSKNCKRAFKSIPHGQIMDEIRKGQQVTRYIKHLANSADFKGVTFNKHCNGLIRNRFEMPNVSYTNPSACAKTPEIVHKCMD